MKQVTKKRKWIIRLLIIGSIAAALKCIFVSLQMDEEYAVSMSYRLLRGDRLFTQLWDPHQTSAFAIEFLAWIFVRLFHTTTYLVIFIRAAGVLMQAAVSWCLYRTACHFLEQEEGLLIGLIYFNLLPKGYVMPEFSNLMVWSLTLLLLCLTRLMALEGQLSVWQMALPEKRRSRSIRFAYAEAGFWLCMTALSYPSCVLLYPFLIWYFWKYDKYRARAIGTLTAVCALIGGGYLANLFSYMTPASFLANVKSLIASGGAHKRTWQWILRIYSADIGRLLLIVLLTFAGAEILFRLLEKRSQAKSRAAWLYLVLIISFAAQVIHWILMLWQYESSYPYAVYFILLGMGLFLCRRLPAAGRQLGFLWMISNVVMFAAIILLTNLTIFTSVKYLMSGVMGVMALLLFYTREKTPEMYRKYGMVTLLLWCFCAVFVKGWAYPDNDGLMKNITVVGNILDNGPGKGILTEYMQGYIAESNYEEFRTYIRPGDHLMVMDSNTICYLYQDVDVAASSTICTPTFDANLLDYWARNPDKYPDVIAVRCWYGELKYDPDSWMMQWITTKFHADRVVDGKFFRYYIRDSR